MPKGDRAITSILTGAAGVHFVVSELCFRGLIALPTIRNTPGIDVIVATPDGRRHANLQVKTSKNKAGFWIVGKRCEEFKGKNNFYVFVRYLEEEKKFEAFLVPADRVAEEIRKKAQKLRARGGEPLYCWYLPKDDQEVEKLKQDWFEFGQNHFR